MVRAILPFYALGLAGCAQVFGIENTTGGTADVPLPPRASIVIQHVSLKATVTATPDATGTTATYYVPDAVDTSGFRRIPATLDGTTWSAEVPDGVAASVEITVPDTSPRRFYTFPNRDLIVQYANYAPSSPMPPDTSTLNVQLTLPAPGYRSVEGFQLYAAGTWRSHSLTSGLPTPDVGATQIGPVDIPYNGSTFNSFIGNTTLEKITSNDLLVALRYENAVLTAAGQFAAFEQTGTDMISATLVDNVLAPLDVMIDPMAISSRLVTSPANGGQSFSYSLSAAPGWRYASNTGPFLRTGVVSPTEPKTTLTFPYGNPFTGLDWQTVLLVATSRGRSYTPPTLNLPVALAAGLNQSIRPGPGSTIDMPAGLPVLVLVNSTPLNSDGLTVAIDPNRSVTLGLVSDKPTCDIYQFNVNELVPNKSNDALVANNVLAAIGPPGEIKIPAGVFTTGKVYSIRAHCYRGGHPGLASGDFSQRDLPLSVGYLDSGVFTVAAP
jgi:hypothetical protein